MMRTPSQRPASSPTLPDAPRRQAPATSAAASAPVILRHAKEGTIALRGPRSGNVYLFSDRATTGVLAADADVLLRTGVLVRCEGDAL